MAHTHEFDCIVCGAHLDSQEQLARHNKDNHIRGAMGMERPRQWGSRPERSGSADDQDRSRSSENRDDLDDRRS